MNTRIQAATSFCRSFGFDRAGDDAKLVEDWSDDAALLPDEGQQQMLFDF